MFLWLWIITIIICLIFTVFPIKGNLIIGRFSNITINITKLVEILLLFNAFILIVSNRTNPDIINYFNGYNYKLQLTSERELLYYFLRRKAYDAGLSFFQFRNIVVLITGLLAVSGIKKANISVSPVLLFYLPVVMFMDSIQFRNEICLYILIYSIYFLQNHNKYSGIIYTIVVILLSQIHTVSIFYLIFLLIRIKDKKKQRKILGTIVGISLILAILTIINSNQVPFVNQIFNFFLSDSDSRMNYTQSSTKFGYLFPAFIHTLIYFIFDYNTKRVKLEQKDELLINTIIGIDECSFLSIPFMMNNIRFYRLLRNSYVISIIGYMFLLKKNKNQNNKFILISGLVIATALWGIWEMVLYDNFHTITDPILKDGVWFLIP